MKLSDGISTAVMAVLWLVFVGIFCSGGLSLLAVAAEAYNLLLGWAHAALWRQLLLGVFATGIFFAVFLVRHFRRDVVGLLEISASWILLGYSIQNPSHTPATALASGLGSLFLFVRGVESLMHFVTEQNRLGYTFDHPLWTTLEWFQAYSKARAHGDAASRVYPMMLLLRQPPTHEGHK